MYFENDIITILLVFLSLHMIHIVIKFYQNKENLKFFVPYR
jgi:hypothetical protein